MEIILQTADFKASSRLKDFVNRKFEKLFKLNRRIIRADVTLYKGNDKTSLQPCEVRLMVPGNDHFVRKSGSTYERSVVSAIQALQAMLRREKTRRMFNRTRSKP